MSARISIIMPCYKAEKYIEDILSDILAQTFTDWELIAVSNGEGQEMQLAIIQRFAEIGGGRIKILTEEKGNVSNARNIGMRAATGEWITFSDADDRIAPNHLQLFMDKVQEADTDIVIGGFKLARTKEGNVRDNRLTDNNLLTKREIISVPETVMAATWNKCFRASFLRKSGVLFEEKWTYKEDHIFVLKLLQLSPTVSSIAMCGYTWVCRDDKSTVSSHHTHYADAMEFTMQMNCKLMSEAGCSEEDINGYVNFKVYIDSYVFVCNLFRQGSPLSLCEQRKEIKAYIFDNKERRAKIKAKNRGDHTPFLRIYDTLFDIGSPLLMALAFRLQYWLKYHMKSLYLKVVPWLRR